jgi:hypothetical protein
VRTFDNSTVCTLPKHVKILVNADGGSYTLCGMVDSRRRKLYPWHIKNLLHLCSKSINLTKQDFVDLPENQEDIEWEILGQPMPGLLPYALGDLYKARKNR